MTTRKLDVDESGPIIVPLSDGRFPSRGVAVRPDHKGRPILHEDGRPLGVVVLETDCADWTDLGRKKAWVEITYTPGVPA